MPFVPPGLESALTLLDDLVRQAKAGGADAAEAILFDATHLSLSQRLGRPEKLERSESGDLGLRVFLGTRQAIVSTTDRTPQVLAELVARAVAMARAVPEDPYCGVADPDQIVRDYPDLDMVDPAEPSTADLIAAAQAAEESALAVAGVTNSEGAEATWGRSGMVMAASNGFVGAWMASRRSLSVSVLAGTGTGMERDYEFTSAVFADGLLPAAEVGRRAGERAVARLNPRKVSTQQVPVVFDPRVSRGLVSHLAGAIKGPSIARGTSFLKDRLGELVFADGIAVIDDPFIRRGLRSRPFDGEGLAVAKRRIIDDGRLTTWLLDLRSARQLGLPPTGHASRGTSSPPSPAPSNLYLAPGAKSRETLIGAIESGFYVTEMMGSGVNGVTGDYSRGATGFWIEAGRIAYPVSEVTVAGNLIEMFRHLEPASDLVLRYGIDAPTVRVDGMTVAGL